MLDEYTLFLSKYGKYITDEIVHFEKLEKPSESNKKTGTLNKNSGI